MSETTTARDELRGTLANTICNASLYTKRAQPYLLGSDMSEVLDKTADAILAAGYRKPLTIENDKLVIDDHGNLLLEVDGCTCASSGLGPEYASCHEVGCGHEYLDDLTAPLARAGYRKPRTITTAEELDALPVGSVVLHHGRSFQRYVPRVVGLYEYGLWQCPDGGFVRNSQGGAMILPATVLHEAQA
jgi:hypothetical protein